jgi:two-component system LytT family response regulator
VDDEPSAVSVLSTLLRRHCKDDVEIVATCNTPEEGRQQIEQLDPDLVFMDVEMPGMTGIELVKSFPSPRFRLVFVTAYDAYALQAFKVSAVDYLLKPIDSEDVVKVVQKIKADIRNELGRLSQQLQHLDKMLNTHSAQTDRKIGIGMADKIVFINYSSILYCEASGPYTNVYLNDGQKLVASKALGEFEAQLPAQKFFRIHHHHLINLDLVKEFQRNDGGYVIMENSKKLEVSQRRRKEFLDALQDRIV